MDLDDIGWTRMNSDGLGLFNSSHWYLRQALWRPGTPLPPSPPLAVTAGKGNRPGYAFAAAAGGGGTARDRRLFAYGQEEARVRMRAAIWCRRALLWCNGRTWPVRKSA